jgi:uroporphyrinogen decarboxylase
MRQAGRSLPEYRRIREGVAMLDACFHPDLIAEITLQPVRRHNVDAAILFSDIVVPLRAAGVDLDIVAGVGPVVAQPVRTRADVERIAVLEPDSVAAVAAGAAAVVAESPVPLIGFAGAPFTLASYLIEGGPSRTYARTKSLMHADPDLWHDLAGRLARTASTFLRVQVMAGASAVQLFDSWAGALSLADYRRFVLPHSAAVFASIADLGVPRIHFGVGTGELLAAMAEPEVEVVGVDFRTSLSDAAHRIGAERALQGNLDPALLGAGDDVLRQEVGRILQEGDGIPGHIFNLGHGVPPDTDPDVLTRIVDWVHELRP